MFARLKEDVRTAFAEDPAARSALEVALCYPGLHAVWAHRLSHWLWTHGLRLAGRLLSHLARFVTGIEIHPAASIGRRFFIDHGMGVVIGETSQIGDDVLMYQGVVLGGTSLEKKKRHPAIGSGVVIGVGAILLGPITVGDGARVGAGSVVIKSVPPRTTVVGVPARRVEKRAGPDVLRHADLPDPVAEVIRSITVQQQEIEKRLSALEEHAKTDIVSRGTHAVS